ncbi:MAG TPA: hypothetical protein VHA78_03830 [Candidatus Peribacteraceae bacterium]|nr:hypothetical protein [Candidatus Peribacteraceae bacterium]
MKTPLRLSTLLLCTLLLTECGGSKTGNAPVDISIIGARNALFWTEQLIMQNIQSSAVSRPAALLGIYVSTFLAGVTALPQSTVTGVTAALDLLTENQEHPDESFALLQQLGTVLQVDVVDMLNRSVDRQQALDSYVSTLQNLYDRSKTQVTALKQQQKDLQTQLRTQQRTVSDIQNALNRALQKQDYTTASTKQEEIVPAQADAAKTQSQLNQLNSTLNLFGQLNGVANKRLAAIQANREVMIAGLHVVNVPGITDLGILQNNGSANNALIFGGTGL